MDYLWMALIGMIAGGLAGQFMTGKGIGVVGDLVTGMVGALTGGVLIKTNGFTPR